MTILEFKKFISETLKGWAHCVAVKGHNDKGYTITTVYKQALENDIYCLIAEYDNEGGFANLELGIMDEHLDPNILVCYKSKPLDEAERDFISNMIKRVDQFL